MMNRSPDTPPVRRSLSVADRAVCGWELCMSDAPGAEIHHVDCLTAQHGHSAPARSHTHQSRVQAAPHPRRQPQWKLELVTPRRSRRWNPCRCARAMTITRPCMYPSAALADSRAHCPAGGSRSSYHRQTPCSSRREACRRAPHLPPGYRRENYYSLCSRCFLVKTGPAVGHIGI